MSGILSTDGGRRRLRPGVASHQVILPTSCAARLSFSAVEVADAWGVSAAAHRLSLSKSIVSRRLLRMGGGGTGRATAGTNHPWARPGL